MGTKAERRATSERVAAYHEARLGELIEYITAAIDRYRAGEIKTAECRPATVAIRQRQRVKVGLLERCFLES